MKFIYGEGRKRSLQYSIIIISLIIIVSLIGGGLYVKNLYTSNLAPLSSNSKEQIVIIDSGSTPTQIAKLLKEKLIIRSDRAFEWYVRQHKLNNKLKAGTYTLSQSQSVLDIVNVLTDGKVATDLVTILPGKRIDQIRQGFVDQGFDPVEVDQALDPAVYKPAYPILKELPVSASLDGYLYPETFQKTADTKLKDIIKLSLDEFTAKLTPNIEAGFRAQGLSTHRALTLASIVEKEVGPYEERRQVAQVFIKRLSQKIRLESNATDAYAKIDQSYDTYKIDGLPPGPISNVSESSMKAVADPTSTDWLFFVSGDDGNTYFSRTIQEHEKLVNQHCTTACGR